MWRRLSKVVRYSSCPVIACVKSTTSLCSTSTQHNKQQQEQHSRQSNTSRVGTSRAKILGWVLGASIFPLATGGWLWYTGDLNKLAAIYQLKVRKSSNSNNTSTDDNDSQLSPKKKLGGPFKIRASKDGSYLTDQQLFNNHWTLLYFGFSKCAEICPTTLTFIAQVLHRCDAQFKDDPQLATQAARLQAAFLSIDFIRDTPQVVEKFVSKYEPRIRGLCGSRLEVERAAQVWHVYYSSVDETDEERAIREAAGVSEPQIDDTYQFDHSAAIYLVGPDGKMKDFFFKEMGVQDMVNRLGVHFSDVYGFSDTRALS